MSQCQDAAETGCAPVAKGWEQAVKEEEHEMLKLHAMAKKKYLYTSDKKLEIEKTG